VKPFPSSVHIGGKRVRIVITKNLEAYGEYHHDKAEIRLSSRVLAKASDLRETLRHEMMHAAMSISGIAFMEKFEEESVVRCFEEIFFPCWSKVSEQLRNYQPPTPP
jgi:hypothetical protein